LSRKRKSKGVMDGESGESTKVENGIGAGKGKSEIERDWDEVDGEKYRKLIPETR